MTKRTDVRSLILGLLIGACLTGCLAAAGVAMVAAGRFQIATNENHVYVLDTVTGQVWQDFAASGSGTTTPGFDEPKIRLPNAKR
jgi:hypothetical protein